MPKAEKIISIEDPRINEFRSLKGKQLINDDLIVIESPKVVQKALSSPIKILKILATEDFFNERNINCDCYFATKDILENIVGHHLHHGVMALAYKPKDISLEEIDDKILIMNGLTSPENVGSLIRTAAAFNINTLIVDHKTCSPYLRRCIRVSMGNIFSMKVIHTENLNGVIQKLPHSIIGSANEPMAEDINTFSFPKKSALIIGSEGHGMDESIKDHCDKIIKISINSNVAHLNAGHAGAILMSHLAL